MSIATAIQAAQQKVADAYTAASAKGATMPATQNLSNLATTISNIPSGSSGPQVPMQVVDIDPEDPTAGTKLVAGPTGIDVGGATIIQKDYIGRTLYQGSPDCTGASFVNSNNLKTIEGSYIFYSCFVGTGFTSTGLDSVENIKNSSAMYYAYQNCVNLTQTGLGNLKYISGNACMTHMFDGCTGLTSTGINWNQIETGGSGSSASNGYMSYIFNGCTGLLTTGFEGKTSIKKSGSSSYLFYSAFSGCTSLTSSGLNDVKEINGKSCCHLMFSDCTSLSDPGLENVEIITDNTCCFGMFKNTAVTVLRLTNYTGNGVSGSTECFSNICSGCQLTDVYFNSLNTYYLGSSVFNNMLSGVTGCTVHLPSNQTYSGSFGGTNTTVLNDLPAVYAINTDETSASTYEIYLQLQKRPNNNVTVWVNRYNGAGHYVYTVGTGVPSVGDWVYEDPECSIQVKQIATVTG